MAIAERGSLPRYRAVVIGCGKPVGQNPGVAEGYRIGYAHGNGYQLTGRTDIVAVADIVEDNARAYADHFRVPRIYTDYREMLAQEKPNIVSVCTWPIFHSVMVVAAARAGARGIVCEKPMAVNMTQVREMQSACATAGATLVVSHQRRYSPAHMAARRFIEEGRIGPVRRMEAWVGGGWDMMSWGTHWVDMLRFYTGDRTVEAVLAQTDWSRRQVRYGHPVEDEIALQMSFGNGVFGWVHLSPLIQDMPGTLVVGTEGMIETRENGSVNVYSRKGSESYDLSASFDHTYRDLILDLLHSIETGARSQCSGENGATATEIIMAGYHSAITNRRVVLPLEHEADVHPLEGVFAREAVL